MPLSYLLKIFITASFVCAVSNVKAQVITQEWEPFYFYSSCNTMGGPEVVNGYTCPYPIWHPIALNPEDLLNYPYPYGGYSSIEDAEVSPWSRRVNGRHSKSGFVNGFPQITFSIFVQCVEGLLDIKEISPGTGDYTATCKSTTTPVPKTCSVGEGLDPAAGILEQTEVDFVGAGSNGLSIRRAFSSSNGHWADANDVVFLDFSAINAATDPNSFANSFGRTYQFYCHETFAVVLGKCKPITPRRLGLTGETNYFGVQRGNSPPHYFGGNADEFLPPTGNNDRITRIFDGNGAVSGFSVYNSSNDSRELFDVKGRLQKVIQRNNQTQTMLYNSEGKLISVTDNFGRKISYTYDSKGRRTSATDPNGGLYLYGYDGPSANNVNGNTEAGNLTSVTYPGGTQRIYWYNELGKVGTYSNWSNALTGITDENGDRYATFFHDDSGTVQSTERAGGAAKISRSSGMNGASASITDAAGVTRVRRFTTIGNTTYDAGQDQPGGSGCSASSNSIVRDANGNVQSKTDFNGARTTFTYDLKRNLPLTRVDAYGTPQAATTMFTWHSKFRLPLMISSPLKRTTVVYDDNGNVLTRTEQSTNDTNGSLGFDAALLGAPQTSTYTWNNVGQMLTSIGPRSDLVDKTTYTYDVSGNMTSVTNATGHVTQFTEYDAAGNLMSMTDPKGIVTAITYTPRGWIKTVTVTPPGGPARLTTYTYDNVGQLTGVQNPDGTSISYTYDAAHRLVGATDARGNSVTYTLDNVGNRIAEQLKDPGGVLQRSMSRSFDALNRVQQLQVQ